LNKIRKPTVAGQFYDDNKSSLELSIKKCFLDKRGPGVLPKIEKGGKKVKGLIVPHAGFTYSGPIAAHSYNMLSKNGFAETFIIIGPNHTGYGSGVSILTEGAWETPLGLVSINEKLGNQLYRDIIDKDENAHAFEHSIEVQLPFLQYTAGDSHFDFVPICMAMQDIQTSKKIGKIIADVIKKSNKKIVMIASTDFSHVGFNYMTMPPHDLRVDEFAEKQDKLAIDKIINLDPEGLIETVNSKNISMCGYGPVASILSGAKTLMAKEVELLKYGTSYDVHPGSSCVGYGALAIY